MRCYNGCPDAELAAVWKSRADVKAKARELGYLITYYPMEDKYGASKQETYENVGPLCNHPEECLSYIKNHRVE